MRRLFLAPIRLYRKRLSATKSAPCCRFEPTCSAYAYKAISEWGVIIGLPMSAFRILRCNPFFPGGYDPIPRRRRKLIPKTAAFGKSTVRDDAPPDYPYLTSYGSMID